MNIVQDGRLPARRVVLSLLTVTLFLSTPVIIVAAKYILLDGRVPDMSILLVFILLSLPGAIVNALVTYVTQQENMEVQVTLIVGMAIATIWEIISSSPSESLMDPTISMIIWTFFGFLIPGVRLLLRSIST